MSSSEPAARHRRDPAGMRSTVEASPGRWAAALEAARGAPGLPVPARQVRAVLVAGMGGSGIAADVAAVAADRHGTVPVLPVKGYELPSFAGPVTPLVGVSFSGDTEEMLSCLEAAGRRGVPRYVVTSGGRAAELAEQEGLPVAYIPGEGQPRANLPALAGTVLVVLERSGLLAGVVGQLADVPQHLDGCLEAWAGTAGGPVVRLAAELAEAVPVFHGARGWMGLAALRAKCQVNENAKRPAFHHEVPERDHNEIVGWTRVPAGLQEHLALVELRSPVDEHPRVRRRFELARELVADRVGLYRLDVDGPSPLARFAAAVLAVDLLSVELALLAGVDPTPVAVIDELKRALAG